MQRLKLYLTFFLIITSVYGCSKSTIKLDEAEKNIDEFEIMVRNSLDDVYVTITDEVIHNNLLQLLNETISEEKIVVSENGYIPFTDDRQIKIIGFKGEDYIISFSIYYMDEYSDGGQMAVIVEKNNDIEYYYMMNDLYNLIPLAKLDNKTFTAMVLGTQRNPLQLTSDIFGSLEVEYESLPENITEGSFVEITLGKITEESNKLYAQSIIVK